MLVLGVVGIAVLTGDQALGSPFRSSIGPAFGLDQLSGFFLAVLAVTAVPTLLFARDYLPGSAGERGVGALTAGFLLALVGVLTARDVTTFLAFWELMTLLPAAAILVARRDASVRGAVYAYLAITHLGGAGVWIALLVLQHHGAIGDPSALAAAGTGAQTLVAITALIGFGTKAGFIPLHSWLPRAHPVAPAHLSALMSGMMIKVAIYGLIRVEFEWLGATPRWLGIALLLIGLISAVGGVLWALVQHDLKRLLAYHSIENVGIIALGLGASLLFADAGAAAVGGDRVCGGAASRRQPCDLQDAPVSRRRRVRARGRQSRPRPSRWAAAPHAVDWRRVPGRVDGDRRVAAAERLRLGVADVAVAAARRVLPAGGGGARGRGRTGRAGGDGGAGAAVLRQGGRLGAARSAAASAMRGRDRSGVRHARRDGSARCAVCPPGARAGPDPSDARASGARRHRRRTDAAARPAGARHGCLPGAGDRDRAGGPDRGLDAAARISGAPLRHRRGPVGSRSCRSSAGPRRRSPSRCGSCSRGSCAPAACSRSCAVVGWCRRSPIPATSPRSSTRCCTSRRSVLGCAPPRSPGACRRGTCAPTPPTCSDSCSRGSCVRGRECFG